MSSTSTRPRVLLVDRGDALVGPLSAAMRDRFDVVGAVDAELTLPERLLVAGSTFSVLRPTRRQWAERFYKSSLGVRLRSRRVRTALEDSAADVVFQTHALFETADPRTVIYIDCTHRQSMQHWPGWNPLHGRALARWLARERRQYHQAAHLFAFYADTARSLIEDYGVPADRVSTVGAGVSLEHLPVIDTRERTTRWHPPTVLFVGNDFERKGGPRLLAAFALLRRRVPEARLRIVGTPYAVSGAPGVEHLGRIHDRALVSRLYAEADVFCLPSQFDPFPGVLLEAMAHGLPSVVTPVGGIPEMVEAGSTALLVSPDGSPLELADALERLLTDLDEADRMGRAARRLVEEQHRWSHVLDRMAPALDQLTQIGSHQTSNPQTALSTPTDTHPRSTTMTQTQDHTRPETFTSDRPWGQFEQFSLNEVSTVKVITVDPGTRLSLQRHSTRSELWRVLDGPMDIEVDERTWSAVDGDLVWVPAGSTHRMGNSGTERARILEVAFGHFDEDDIERLHDDYARS